MKILKRNGTEVDFNKNKIIDAIKAANKEVISKEQLDDFQINSIAVNISDIIENSNRRYGVEDIQDMVEDEINTLHKFVLGRVYSQYRFKRALQRKSNETDDKILSLVNYTNQEVKEENSNKNPQIVSVQRDYVAGEVSKDITMRELLPEDIVRAHEDGIIHFHDSDYFIQKMNNCGLVNLADMFINGTVINGKFIDSPKSFHVGCNVMTQIMAQVASSQYGGQSMTLSHLAPLVDVSRQKIYNKLLEENSVESYDELNEDEQKKFDRALDLRLKNEIKDGVQTIQYQVNTLMTTNGQAPFITLFMYIDEVEEGRLRDDLVLIIEEVLRQRIQGIKNEKGVWVTPEFPKLIYVLDEDNIYEDSKYFELTKLAAECTAKRMVPDYISAKKMKEIKGDVYTCMGCRSFLTVEDDILNKDGSHKYYGRFNQGVVTINLVDVALSSNKDEDKFWDIIENRLESLCHRALRARHERLLGTPSDFAPIIWQYGGYGRLEKGENIDKLLKKGYSTISLGYAGLYECVYYMKGKSHTDPEAKEFAKAVMQKLNDKCKEWREKEDIGYSVYGTPIESTTYKFATKLKERFGEIPGVTDHNYITNSYHVPVTEEIDAFTKLEFESEFQILSPGGAISYVEIPDLKDNLEAVIEIMQFIYETIIYAELNGKFDYCYECGYEGEIKVLKDTTINKWVWECPCCKNREENKMNVARRTCGYIGANFWNQGRTEEIAQRVLHIDNKDL